MEAFTIDKILLLTIFFVPGFVYLKTYRLLIADIKTDFSKDLYEAIGYSFLNSLVFAYPLYLINDSDFISNHAFCYYLILLSIVVLVPISFVFLYHYITKKKLFNKHLINPTKTAWDSFFSKRESYYVIVTFKNGRRVGGKYGLNSHASTYPSPKDIYLEEVWKLNKYSNGFIKAKNNTEGIFITENEISTIEFFI